MLQVVFLEPPCHGAPVQISFWRQIPYNDNFRLPCPVEKNFCRKSLRLGQTTLRQNKKNSRNQTFLIRFYWKSEFRKFRLLKNIFKFLIFYFSVSDKKIRIVAKNRYWRYLKQTKNAKKNCKKQYWIVDVSSGTP